MSIGHLVEYGNNSPRNICLTSLLPLFFEQQKCCLLSLLLNSKANMAITIYLPFLYHLHILLVHRKIYAYLHLLGMFEYFFQYYSYVYYVCIKCLCMCK